MKYIRTTKGIWEIEKLAKQDYEWLQKGENKQADSIEELCDEFVLIHTEYDNSKDIFESYSGEAKHRGDPYYNFTFEQIRTGRRIIKGTIYGAIWTEWGLKYVAKMNGQGELELL